MFRRRFHAVIKRQAHDDDVRDAVVLEQGGQAAVGLAERIAKGAVHFAVGAGALVDGVGEEMGAEGREEEGAGGVGDAVGGPEGGGIGGCGVGVGGGVGRGIRVGV